MSTPILPFAVWATGTNSNATPANDNSLRNQILNGLVISDSTDAQPGSPTDGDIYIITGAATGAQWATFDEFDLTIYSAGTWYAFAPVEGMVVNLAGALVQWDGAAYSSAGGGGGSTTIDIITEAIAFTADPATHAGTNRLLLCGGDVEFDVAETYAAGQAFNLYATGAVELIETGVTLTPPSGGTLELTAGMTVTVVMSDVDEGLVIGQTVPA